VNTHLFSGEGLSDDCGAVLGCEMSFLSQLPSADDSARPAPIKLYQIDYIDLADLVDDLVLDTYSVACGTVDPTRLSPSSDDDFDLDLLDDDDSSQSSISPSAESSLDAPSFHRLHPTSLPASDVDSLTTCIDPLDTGTRALYALDLHLREVTTTRSQYYRQLRTDEPALGSSAPVRAHMDGGAMASTTDRLDFLWHLVWFEKDRRTPALRVADDHDHFPTAVGYLRIPTDDPLGFKMTQCYYTPTLPATILPRRHR